MNRKIEFNKIIVILLLFWVNCVFFFIYNLNHELIEEDRLYYILWGWSIFLYIGIYFCISVSYIGIYNYKKKVIPIIFLDLISGIIIGISYNLYIYTGLYNISKKTLTIIIVLSVFVQIIATFIYNSGTKKYNNIKNEVESEIIEKYIFKNIMNAFFPKDKEYYSDSNNKRMYIVTSNALSCIYLLIYGSIAKTVIALLKYNIVSFSIIVILFVIFVMINYKKYQFSEISGVRFIIDMSFIFIAIIFYAISERMEIFQGFLHILITVHILTPFIFTCYKIGNIYQLGLKEVGCRKSDQRSMKI